MSENTTKAKTRNQAGAGYAEYQAQNRKAKNKARTAARYAKRIAKDAQKAWSVAIKRAEGAMKRLDRRISQFAEGDDRRMILERSKAKAEARYKELFA